MKLIHIKKPFRLLERLFFTPTLSFGVRSPLLKL